MIRAVFVVCLGFRDEGDGMLMHNLLGLPPNSRLIISRPKEAWSTKILLVTKN